MAFLDNSGDIILDAVLTDAGRKRLARGEFSITKFAFSDEEINYTIFNSSHSSGSAFYDIDIMQTPILEAFTNNSSLMKTKLVSLNRQNILFMPIFKLNNKQYSNKFDGRQVTGDKYHGIIVDSNTASKAGDGVEPFNASDLDQGYLLGFEQLNSARRGSRAIVIDQGIDGAGATNLEISQTMDSDLKETAYLVKLDNRLLTLDGYDVNTTQYVSFDSSFVDDDNIATYYIPSTSGIVQGDRAGARSVLSDPNDNDFTTVANTEIFYTSDSVNGPVGPRIYLHPVATSLVQHSDALFTEIGSTQNSVDFDTGGSRHTAANHKIIDTVMNVVGITTGYSIDIPLRLYKK
jgi:hypothetical protein